MHIAHNIKETESIFRVFTELKEPEWKLQLKSGKTRNRNRGNQRVVGESYELFLVAINVHGCFENSLKKI